MESNEKSLQAQKEKLLAQFNSLKDDKPMHKEKPLKLIPQERNSPTNTHQLQ